MASKFKRTYCIRTGGGEKPFSSGERRQLLCYLSVSHHHLERDGYWCAAEEELTEKMKENNHFTKQAEDNAYISGEQKHVSW
jgi:hypothetical protein